MKLEIFRTYLTTFRYEWRLWENNKLIYRSYSDTKWGAKSAAKRYKKQYKKGQAGDTLVYEAEL